LTAEMTLEEYIKRRLALMETFNRFEEEFIETLEVVDFKEDHFKVYGKKYRELMQKICPKILEAFSLGIREPKGFFGVASETGYNHFLRKREKVYLNLKGKPPDFTTARNLYTFSLRAKEGKEFSKSEILVKKLDLSIWPFPKNRPGWWDAYDDGGVGGFQDNNMKNTLYALAGLYSLLCHRLPSAKSKLFFRSY